jgi:hypothetical protein
MSAILVSYIHVGHQNGRDESKAVIVVVFVVCCLLCYFFVSTFSVWQIDDIWSICHTEQIETKKTTTP